MEWLTGNAFFVVILLVCVGMHFFHGHGGHGKHGARRNNEDDRMGADREWLP